MSRSRSNQKRPFKNNNEDQNPHSINQLNPPLQPQMQHSANNMRPRNRYPNQFNVRPFQAQTMPPSQSPRYPTPNNIVPVRSPSRPRLRSQTPYNVLPLHEQRTQETPYNCSIMFRSRENLTSNRRQSLERKRDSSSDSNSSFQTNNLSYDDDVQSIVSIESESEREKEFLLNTFQDAKWIKKVELEKFIETNYKDLLEEFRNDITRIIQRKYELESKIKNRLHETNEVDEERKALDCELKLAEKNIESLINEMDRLKLTNQNYLPGVKYAYEREFDRARRKLPFYGYRKEIIDKLKTNDVLVIIGQTGSGKTTQVPQYLVEYGFARHRKTVCTQPRRIATETVSKRIAEEMKCSNSKLIAHKLITFKKITDVEKKTFNKQNKLLFMTDKNLLSEYKRDKKLSRYGCVIVDEAHERTLFTDILLAELKKLVNERKGTKNPLKLIIMSATIDKNKFSNYFNNCPIIEVPGQTFPVKITYAPKENDYVKQCINKLNTLINEDSINGDVLVFLPTINDIKSAIKTFNKERKNNGKYIILPLHGKLEPEEQAKVFEEDDSKYKIIFSTNIAETSVTIKGVSIVIDSGRAKERTYDQKRNISVFKIKLITQSSAIQRKGRAGRCSPGVCYRLYSSQDYEDMEPILEPEIFRMHLGIVVLQMLSCGIEDIFEYDLIDKPTNEALKDSIEKLKSLQMIKDGKITDYGVIASELYLEPSIARIIVEGLKLGVGNEILKIAAMMTVTYCLYSRALSDDEKEQRKLSTTVKEGDFVSLLNIYNQFLNTKKRSRFEWCNSNHYSISSLSIAEKTCKELYFFLAQIKNNQLATLIKNQRESCKTLDEARINLILKCICAGLHSNLAYFDGKINNQTSVYKILDLDQQAFISKESVLYVLGEADYDNRFLLYSDLDRDEKLYMRNLTPVNIQMLREYTKHNLNEIKSLAKVEVVEELSDKLLKNKNEEFIENLERELGHAVIIKSGFLTTYVPQSMETQARTLIKKYIDDIKLKSSNELYEYIPECEMVNYKVLFKSGLNVQAILFTNEYLRINIYDLPSATDPNHIESLFKKYGSLIEFKLNKTASNKLNGHVLFSNFQSAKNAFDILNNMIYLDTHLNLKPCNHVDGSKVLRNTRVKASWFISEANGVAFIKFANGSNLELIKSNLKSLGYNSLIDDLSENKITVYNALSQDQYMDEKNFKNLLSNFSQVEDCYFQRKEIKEEDMLKNSATEGKKIRDFFQKFGRFDEIDIIPYGVSKSGKLVPKITVNIKYGLSESVNELIKALDNKKIPPKSGLIGYGRIHIGTNIVHEYKIHGKATKLFNIKSIKENLERNYDSILIHKENIDKKETDLLIIKSKNHECLNKAVGYAKTYFEPSIIHMDFFKCDQLRKILNKKNSENNRQTIESQYNVFIHPEAKSYRFSIYGSKKEIVKEKLIKEVDSYVTQSVTIKIKSIKAIWGKSGEVLNELKSNFRGEINLVVKSKTIKFDSKESQIDEFKKKIAELEAAFLKEKKISKTYENICALCTDEITNQFVLSSCEHKFCYECISLQLKAYDMSSNDLSCIVCNKDITISDLKSLAKNDDELFKNKCSIALSKYMSKQSKYMFCTYYNCSKICNRYDVSQIYCNECETEVKKLERTQEIQRREEAIAASEAYIANERGINRCPNENCKMPILKDGGCNHMQCRYCKIHFCWICLFKSDQSKAIYEHMNQRHGGWHSN